MNFLIWVSDHEFLTFIVTLIIALAVSFTRGNLEYKNADTRKEN